VPSLFNAGCASCGNWITPFSSQGFSGQSIFTPLASGASFKINAYVLPGCLQTAVRNCVINATYVDGGRVLNIWHNSDAPGRAMLQCISFRLWSPSLLRTYQTTDTLRCPTTVPNTTTSSITTADLVPITGNAPAACAGSGSGAPAMTMLAGAVGLAAALAALLA
jgi:hypothetical protein